MRFRRAFLIALIGGLLLSLGNMPAPYYACAGKAVGDACIYGYGCSTGGRCALEPDCVEDPEWDINQCLVCRTGS